MTIIFNNSFVVKQNLYFFEYTLFFLSTYNYIFIFRYIFPQNVYNLLIQELKQAKPDLRIIIMEPFALKGSETEENWDAFKNGVAEKAAAAKRVAEQNGLEFISLQDKLDKACEKAPANYWLFDGVHPSAAGHELIAREWIKQFELKSM